MKTAPILIVGGGPAGGLTALQLARRGFSCHVLEAATDFQAKPGETLAPNCGPLLQRLGVEELLADPRHLASHGNQFVWGSEEVQEKIFLRHTSANGWHLDRAQFEKQLAELSQREGVIWRMGCKVREAIPGANWKVSIEQDGQTETLTTPFLVDASGRRALVATASGAERIQQDALVGLTSILNVDRELPRLTRIEAVPGGWWYAAPIVGRRLVTSFFTDPNILPKNWRKPHAYWSAIQQVASFQEILPSSQPEMSPPQVRQASSSYLSRLYGNNWLAVGDAAFGYDPISSYGITAAMGAGFYAASAIAGHLCGKTVALPAYAHLQTQAYEQYLSLLQRQYALEQRWPDAPFWLGRNPG